MDFVPETKDISREEESKRVEDAAKDEGNVEELKFLQK